MSNIYDVLQIRIDCIVGKNFTELVKAAHELACQYGCEVVFDFNGKEYIVHYNSNIPKMVADFYHSLI